jgi:rifampicin phosphotransferase
MKAALTRKPKRPSYVLVAALGEADQVAGAGGKAVNLARMMRLGISVPAGLVITDHVFQLFQDQGDLRSFAAKECAAVDSRRPETFAHAAQTIRQRVLASPIPANVWEAIVERLAELLAGVTLVVRSSALGEDGAQASFAGQLDSILHVDSESALHNAILTCWASYWSPRSLFYQHTRGVALAGMGVVLQVEVAARAAGVLFTRHPEVNTSGGDDMVIEYCAGQAEALVSGRVNPGRYLVSRHHGEARLITKGDQDLTLADPRVRELVQIGLRLEHAFESPQDIEWCLDSEEHLEIVQSRPITTSVKRTPASHEASVSEAPSPTDRLVRWSNANVNENFPEPICPLLYSIAADGYYQYFRNLGVAFGIRNRRIDAMEHALRHLIGVHSGRMYYNLTNLHAVLQQAPLGDLLTRYFNLFVGASSATPAEIGVRSNRVVELLELGRMVLHAGWQFLFLSRRVAQFEETVDRFADASIPEDLPAKTSTQLRDLLRDFLDIRCRRWKNASLADAAAMISYGTLERFLQREFPAQDMAALHNTLLKGLRDIVSSKPAAALWRLSRLLRANECWRQAFETQAGPELLMAIRGESVWQPFRIEFEGFLNDWGFRCSGELMLTTPSFQEEPVRLLDILRAYVALEGDVPPAQLEDQQASRMTETEQVLQALKKRKLGRWLPWPRKSLVARILLSWTQRSIGFRERARLKQALLYSRCRRIALAIGARGFFEKSDDVFFLTHQELESLLSGVAMFPHQARELVALRRRAHADFTQMQPPDDFSTPEGSYLQTRYSPEQPAVSSADETCLTGVGACGGKATGRAALLQDVSEVGRLEQGDILIVRQTDPGWGPVFFLIKGLVMERGGMLSHGAILAREYGIPTVVGVPGATSRLRDVRNITVDGDHGSVHVVEE